MFVSEGAPGRVPSSCINSCIYKRIDTGKMYCFAPGDLHVECEDDAVTGPPDDCECDSLNDEQLPGSALVRILDRYSSESLCIGLLVASEVILCPGSCMEGASPQDMSVSLGTFSPSLDTLSMDVEEIVTHDNLTYVSLLKLGDSVDLDTYSPLCYSGPSPSSPLSRQSGQQANQTYEEYLSDFCEYGVKAQLQAIGLDNLTEDDIELLCLSIAEIADLEGAYECASLQLASGQRQLFTPPPSLLNTFPPDFFPPCLIEMIEESLMLSEWTSGVIQETGSRVCKDPAMENYNTGFY